MWTINRLTLGSPATSSLFLHSIR
uniref:Uncharacterized protein n=1 Tax=Rhizophora mucronata TaxID=61149 RepID=A0A2P2N4Z7_RHIMU